MSRGGIDLVRVSLEAITVWMSTQTWVIQKHLCPTPSPQCVRLASPALKGEVNFSLIQYDTTWVHSQIHPCPQLLLHDEHGKDYLSLTDFLWACCGRLLLSATSVAVCVFESAFSWKMTNFATTMTCNRLACDLVYARLGFCFYLLRHACFQCLGILSGGFQTLSQLHCLFKGQLSFLE